MSGLKVAGACPMGCGETLFVAEGGHITCSWHACPNPGVVDELLTGRDTEHVVLIGEQGWSITHPLREHGQDLQMCALHQHLRGTGEAPTTPGRYRVVLVGAAWSWRPLWVNGHV